jgi:putative Mg2+ transporter-C (MgtC) family protein
MEVVPLAVEMTSFDLDVDALVRLLAAAVLGAAVGVDRELGDQAAGLRTHIAVALGAALFGVVSTLGFDEFVAPRASTNVQISIDRVASNVVVGIGFLGAGLITRLGSNQIRNLTTAASMWAVAAIGLTCGVGDIGVAGVATAVLLLCLGLLRPIRSWIRRRFARTASPVRIGFSSDVDPLPILGELDRADEVEVDELVVEKQDGRLVVVSTLRGHPDDVRAWITSASARSEVDFAQQM